MSSEVDIANLALDMIGAKTITALDEGSRNANVANRLYSQYRDALLRRYAWKFATKRIKLARSSNTPVFEFDYQYPVPSDFIRVLSVSDNQDHVGTIRYKLEYDATDTRVIACSADELWLRYIAKITDSGIFDPDFVLALATKMAQTMAMSIAESNTLAQAMKAEYREALAAARSVASMEDFPDEFPEGSWVGVRGVDPSGGWG